MSSNYFGRNLKRQQQLDNNRPRYLRYGDVFVSSRNNPNRQQQKYSPNFSTTTMYRENPQNFNDERNNNSNNKYRTFDAANIDRIRTTNQLNSNNKNMYNQYEDDVNYFPQNSNNKINNSSFFNQQVYNNDLDDNYDSNEVYDNYPFPNNNGKVNYKKRQLPPLQQQYSSRNSQYNLQYDNQYWDDYDPYQSNKNNKKQENNLSFKFIWQKFIITFTSTLSIVCIAWIAYHWHSSKSESNQSSTPELIEPDKPSFKVLPDIPGGVDIPYQDKSIYNRVDPTFHQRIKEQLRVPQEVPNDIPTVNTPQPNITTINTSINNTSSISKGNTAQIEEYSIIDEKDYYVKCPIDGDKNVAIKQLNLLKKKLSTFPDTDMLENTTCAIRTVANTTGQKGKFILIGPFCDDNTAKQIGHFCKIKGEIISVRKVNRS